MTIEVMQLRARPHLWLIHAIGVIVPRRLRADWRQEWEAELRYRETLLADWDRLDFRHRVELLRRSTSAFWDAVWLQTHRWEDDMIQDLRFGLRMLFKNPGFTSIAVLTLALGIGANTAIFSVVNSVLLNPLPYGQADRLAMVWDNNPELGRRHESPSPGNYQDLRNVPGIFAASAAWYVIAGTLTGEQNAEQLQCALVTPDFFTTLGMQPASGNVFSGAETPGVAMTLGRYVAGDRQVVISDALWRRRFGASPSAVGGTLTINGTDWRVQGIMPPRFALPDREVDLWIPWDMARSYAPRFAAGPPRDFRFLNIVARLQPGLTPEQAQAQLAVFSAGLAERHPKENEGWQLQLTPLLEEQVGKTRPLLLLLLCAVALVLLIACANVASLWLTRAAARQHEVAVRAALGATRMRLVRQWLTETLLLAVLGGVGGLALARYGLTALLAFAPADIPRLDEVGIDRRVLLFALAATALTGLLTGLFPAWRIARTELATTLKEGGEKGAVGAASQRFRNALVVAEIALALVLLVGAGLLTRSFALLIAVEPGFDARNLLTMHISLHGQAYGREKTATYFRELLERLRALPGVVSAAAVTTLPMSTAGTDFERPYWREGEPEPSAAADKVSIRMATPEYLPTLGIPLLAGRNFTAQDRAETPAVIIVSESFANKVWPGASAVGNKLVLDYLGGKYAYQVVGISRDIRYYGLKSQPQPEVFIPHAQNPYLPMNVVVRTDAAPLQLVSAVRQVARGLDAAQPISQVNTMEQLIQRSIAPDRFALVLLGLLALLALLLANVGIYSVLSYTVAARTHEIGVRMALGATSRDVLGLALGQGMRLTLVGITLGLLSAYALTRLMEPLLFGVSATDPLTLFGGALLLALVAWLACYLPARRATRVDSLVALRHE
jgi:putative ABC transport system permease protein